MKNLNVFITADVAIDIISYEYEKKVTDTAGDFIVEQEKGKK